MAEPPRRESQQPLAAAYLEFTLPAEVDRIRGDATSSSGRSARTLVKFDDLRIVLTTMRAGARIAEHRSEASVSIHVLSGTMQVRAGNRRFQMGAGALLALDRSVPHEVEAIEEGAFLLTLAR